MITLGINEFLRRLGRNYKVIIQMTIVYVMALFVTSSFVEQYYLMSAVDGFYDETGIIIGSLSNAYDGEIFKYPTTVEELNENLIKVENIVYTQNGNLYEERFEPIGSRFNLDIVSYDENQIEWRPNIIYGEWHEDIEHTEGIINIVISSNFPAEISVGDVFDMSGYRFRVTGIFDEYELNFNRFYPIPINKTGSYLQYYHNIGESNEQFMENGYSITYLAYASMEDCNREKFKFSSKSSMTIDYKDDISEDEMIQNEKFLMERYGYQINYDMVRTKASFDYSWKLLNIKLMPMVFIFIVVFVVSATCLITSGAINVLYEKRNYGVYFICGNNWNNTLLLSFINWSCIAGTSLILAVSASLLMKASGKFDNLALSFSAEHVIVIVTITVIMLLLALALPYRMLKKLQPVNILKDNDK